MLTGNKYLQTLLVLEKEAEAQIVEEMRDRVNALTYRNAKDVLVTAGVPEDAANRLAARLTLRMKRSMQSV